MKFSDILDNIQQAWKFIRPPFIYVFILAAEMFYIVPQLLPQLIVKSISGNFNFLIDPSFQQAIEFYGINKLFPLFILIGIIFMLYFVRFFVWSIGNILPGHLSYSKDDLLIHAASRFTLAEWWGKYPDLKIWDLLHFLENRLAKQSADSLSNIKYWEEKHFKYILMFKDVKVYILWALLVPLLSRHFGVNYTNAIGKAFVIIVLLLFIQVFVFFKQIYTLEQIGFAMVAGIEDMLVNDPTITKVDTAIIEQKRKLISDEWVKDNQKRWWIFTLVDMKEIRWFIKNFIAKDTFPRTTSNSTEHSKRISLWKRFLRAIHLHK